MTAPYRRSPRLHPLRRSPRLALKGNATPAVTEERPRKRQKTSRMPSEDVFQQHLASLTEEEKEIQAVLLMWCIAHSVPFTLALFEKYKHSIQWLREHGLF